MKTPSLVALLLGVLVLGASIATNVWQRQQIAARDTLIQEKIAMGTSALADARRQVETVAQLQKQLGDALRSKAEQAATVATYEEIIAGYRANTTQLIALTQQAKTNAAAQPVVRASAPAAETYAPRSAADEAPVPVDRIQAAVKRKAEQYYKTEHTPGSGSSLVFNFNVNLDEPRARPGWTGRYEVTGEAWFQYYDSIWGGSFSSGRGYFSAEVEVAGGAIRVIDFSRRNSAPM